MILLHSLFLLIATFIVWFLLRACLQIFQLNRAHSQQVRREYAR